MLLGYIGALIVVVAAEKQPNIIFILADDLGNGDVGFTNAGSSIQTPNLDKMASEGWYRLFYEIIAPVYQLGAN